MAEDGSLSLGVLAVAETLRISAPTVLDAMLGRLTREACDRRLASWSRRLVEEMAVELDVHGLSNVPSDGETFVLMSNHQSHFDIPVLFRVVPGSMRMVAKTELYRIPVFGRALHAAEFIEVDRSDKQRSRESIEVAKNRLRSGVHVWIAPEGTRSATGKLGAFKKGGFVLALDTHTRILPITLDGTRFVVRPHQNRLHRGQRVRIEFHPPIDPASYGFERRDALVADVRAAIASSLPEELRG